MNKLNNEKRVQIINALVEGNSVRATARMCDVAFNTVLKLLPEIGKACADYQDRVFRNLPCKRIQCDEIWSFCYAKEKNLPTELRGKFGFGSVWTWVALDANTKLVPSWLVGDRTAETAAIFIDDLASRLANRVQLSTDGHRAYLNAITNAFGNQIDYATITKLYRNPPEGDERRYSPGECCGVKKDDVKGYPDAKHISTSYVERQNLTMRMSMRRFTRLTNGFSKKVENHSCAVALHYMHYNFCRIHKSLRVTPAMEAGVTDHVWSIEELAGLLDAVGKIAA
ncbi:MAG: DDE-type integrase/transposase/recombinase [Deltaproteobacteria bacterium]|nr:DDE-type integrase/transposase/recombinase [Deltaproteobacteria bacterium]